MRDARTIVAAGFAAMVLSPPATAQDGFVVMPTITDNTVAPRVVYIENPRFSTVSGDELITIVERAAAFVDVHFDIRVVVPARVETRHIDSVFGDMIGKEPDGLADLIGDFQGGTVDWDVVRGFLVDNIAEQTDPIDRQVAFAEPYLVEPVTAPTAEALADAVIDTFEARLMGWTVATLEDGHPVIGAVPGRPDHPLNEYGYWALMAKLGFPAEIILTNQLVASVEYMPVPVHTSIRGGITGGSTEYNPASNLGTSVWVSLFPFLSEHADIVALRNGETYGRDDALTYAAAMLAHEMGHQLLQLGHPWANPACVMRPAEVLDFSAWVSGFDETACSIASSAAMTPGSTKAPVW